ncbi:MAG: amino acid permease, partial [Mesorhizobium sp.]
AVSGFFALAMAQIASAFPTAGGLYHWASILGNRFTGWLTAWLNLFGLITVLGAINIGTAFFFVGTFGSWFGITGTPGEIVGFVAFITVLQALFNHFGIKLTAMLTDASGFLILGATAVLIVACLVFAPAIDISRLWTFTNYSGDAGGGVFPQTDSMSYLFLLCLLLPVYTITGYDASAHTSEETLKAAHSVPRAIVSSVLWSSLIGWVMLCAIVLAVTSASRMLFAFSRDGGMPIGSASLAKVNPTWRTPVNAIWTAAILEILYVFLAQFISIGGTNIYTIVVNSTLVFLFLSFIIPIVLGMLAFGTAKWPTPGPWNLGAGLFKLFCALSIVGMVIIFYIAIQPPNDKVLYITIGFIVLTALLWFGFENRRFQGPPIGDQIAKRQAAIKAAEVAIGEAGA